MDRVGVIDLGSNTFHLLIAREVSGLDFETLHKEAFFVKLASEGIGYIGKEPWRRGLEVMDTFAARCRTFEVGRIRALGTAALRQAENAASFLEAVKERTGIQVSVISGEEEAALIALGVHKAIAHVSERVLIMDIGGGSVEFILTEKEQTLWAKSFPIGIAILFRHFHGADPMSGKEVEALTRFLDDSLGELEKLLQVFPTRHLVGASGTFDVLENILSHALERHPHASTVKAELVFPVIADIVQKTLQERLDTQHIPETRVEMIVSALLLIRVVLGMGNFQQLTFSAYAMKEGILRQMIRGIY